MIIEPTAAKKVGLIDEIMNEDDLISNSPLTKIKLFREPKCSRSTKSRNLINANARCRLQVFLSDYSMKLSIISPFQVPNKSVRGIQNRCPQ